MNLSPEREVVIPLTVSRGSDTATDDYSGIPASVTFASGQIGRNFTFSAIDDAVNESPETLTVGLGTLPDWVSLGQQSTSQITIADNDPPPKVTGVTVAEHNARLQIDWSAALNATGYKVQWKSGLQTFAAAPGDNREAVLSQGSDITYVIGDLTNGTEYTVRVIATKKNAPDGEASDEVKGTPAFSNILPTGLPAIAGQPEVGERLTASTAGIMDDNGLSNAVFAYQWIRVDSVVETDITGETGATYDLQADDEGKKIKVRVTFEDDNGTQEELTSPAYPASGFIAAEMLSPRIFVSNIAGGFKSTATRVVQAQSFRTGHNPAGYTLTTVEVVLSSVADVDPTFAFAAIREDAPNPTQPGVTVQTCGDLRVKPAPPG